MTKLGASQNRQNKSRKKEMNHGGNSQGFKPAWKEEMDRAKWKDKSRLFKMVEAAKAKDRRPWVDLIKGTWSSWLSEDLKE
jgi:hypothetical protein